MAECSVAAPDVGDGVALLRSECGEADLGEIIAGLHGRFITLDPEPVV